MQMSADPPVVREPQIENRCNKGHLELHSLAGTIKTVDCVSAEFSILMIPITCKFNQVICSMNIYGNTMYHL